MAKAAKPKNSNKSQKSQKSPDKPDEPEIEEIEEENGEETPSEKSPPAEGAADEPVPPPAGSSAIIIDGEGTMLIAGQLVERGKPIKVNEDQLAELKAGHYRFKEV